MTASDSVALDQTGVGGPRIGANYVPSRQWWFAWENWDAASITEDLQALAELGIDHLRIQLLWPVFQPEPDRISTDALDRLDEFMGLADEVGLGVAPTVLDGWLSGFDFRPTWVGTKNIFQDQEVLEAQGRLLDAVGKVSTAHPNLLALDIGNEINVLAHETPHNSVPYGGADDWARKIVARARLAVGAAPVVIGIDNRPLTDPDSALSIECAATVGDLSVVHAWPYFSGALERYGHTDPGSYAIADYMVQLLTAHHREPGRPVWVQEFGTAEQWVPPDAFEEFVQAQIAATLQICDLWAVTWWASHDIDRSHQGFADLEYGLGLLDVHNNVKPAGRILADFVRRSRAGELVGEPRDGAVTVPDRPSGIQDADDFFAAYRAGQRPRIVVAERQ